MRQVGTHRRGPDTGTASCMNRGSPRRNFDWGDGLGQAARCNWLRLLGCGNARHLGEDLRTWPPEPEQFTISEPHRLSVIRAERSNQLRAKPRDVLRIPRRIVRLLKGHV